MYLSVAMQHSWAAEHAAEKQAAAKLAYILQRDWNGAVSMPVRGGSHVMLSYADADKVSHVLCMYVCVYVCMHVCPLGDRDSRCVVVEVT